MPRKGHESFLAADFHRCLTVAKHRQSVTRNARPPDTARSNDSTPPWRTHSLPPPMTNALHDLWRSLVQSSGRELSDTQISQLERYLTLLNKANETMNLTRVSDPDKARLLHIADALTL